MLKTLRNKALATAIVTTVATFAGAGAGFAQLPNNTSAWGEIAKTGNAGGAIHVTSDDGQSWTKIESSQFSFPVAFTAHSLEITPLNRIWIVQGNPLDVTYHDIYDTADPGTGLQGPTFHSDSKTLFGATLNLTNGERSDILSKCNAKLKPFANEQPQHQTDIQIPVTLVMQTTSDGVGISDGVWANGVVLDEEWETVNFTLPVVCDGFTRETPSVPGGVATPNGGSELKKVELALSQNGVTANGTLEYVGSCPTGITLDMGWFTTLSSSLKSYVQHKNVVGSHDWESPAFSVTTNQAAPGGLWKKEMSDFVAIPFGGSSAVGGVQVNHDVPSNGLQVGGSGGGGGTPQNGLAATNTGGDSDAKKYVGFFRLVAYQSKKTVPVLKVGGGWTNKVVYTGQKTSPWRKYDITCEPKKSTVAGGGPKAVVLPPVTGTFNPDNNPFPKPQPPVDTTFDPASRDLTIPPMHKVNPVIDIVRQREDEKRANAAAEEKRRQDAIIAAQKLKAAQDAAEAERLRREALQARLKAAQDAAEAKRRQDALIAAQRLQAAQELQRLNALKVQQAIIAAQKRRANAPVIQTVPQFKLQRPALRRR